MADGQARADAGNPSASTGRQQISTVLFLVLAVIAIAVLGGLAIVSVQLASVRSEVSRLRDRSLPRLIKLSQLSQEATASIAIAPALSTNPTRFEFETLLSRIKDKERSQETLIAELGGLITDKDAVSQLQNNRTLLSENQQTLTDTVRQQIDVRKRLERHVERLRKFARTVSEGLEDEIDGRLAGEAASANIHRILAMLQDPNRARFSRNKKEIDDGIAQLDLLIGPTDFGPGDSNEPLFKAVAIFRQYWSEQKDHIIRDKTAELTNAFKIKALVEENSLIANRLLSSASTEFARASTDLTEQAQLAAKATRTNLIAMAILISGFVAGSILLWVILKRRVFRRLDRIRRALRAFSDDRARSLADPVPDEIGEISHALMSYMDAIDAREKELTDQTTALEQLSGKLSKYLSPQVYDSIFAGRQEVKVASTRKKLTVFFSDIAGFTEAADRLESEELTQLLNHYLTEMSKIALEHGATIDKYVGDAIMIFFGDPGSKGIKEDASACVRMAIAMRQRLAELGEIWRRSGIEKPLVCRTGIHTGFCTVGNFGSESRMDYTIIGSAVNTAARLEASAQPGEILISYETYALVRDAMNCEPHGEIEVKGIAHPVTTYLVVGETPKHAPNRHRIREKNEAMTIEIDVEAMTEPQRRRAANVLRRALADLDKD